MLFGFVVAAIAGFLLTAIPNWTGRMPLQGLPLAVLILYLPLLWIAGLAWSTAFGLFVVHYGRMLLSR
jgi:uncharacterized protein involved in response to NO